MLLLLDYGLGTIISPKVWEPTDPISYYMVGASYFSDSIFFGASGSWNGNSNSSAIIFRMSRVDLTGATDTNDYSCVSFRDIRSQEYDSISDSLYFDVASRPAYGFPIPSVHTSDNDQGDNYDTVFQFESEWLNDANGISFSTFIYAEPYDWGFNLMPNTYDFRVPQLLQQCGAYSRNNIFEGYSNFQRYDGTNTLNSADSDLTHYEDYGDHFVSLTMGELGFIQLNAPSKNCQHRPIELVVYSAGNDSLKIETTWIKYDAENLRVIINAGRTVSEQTRLATKTYQSLGARMLLQDSMSIASPGSYALVIRYQDAQDGDSYYDHAMNIVIHPVAERSDDWLQNDYECYQNPYPTSFGGCSDGCEMIMYDFQELQSTSTDALGYRTDIVISGSVSQEESFMKYPYENQMDAFLMKINDVAIPQWYTIFSLSRVEDDAITTVTAVNGQDYAYCYLTTNPGSYSFSSRQNAILKVDLSNGLLNSQYTLNLYNKLEGGLYIHEVGQIYDSLETTFNIFAFSFVYSTEAGSDY